MSQHAPKDLPLSNPNVPSNKWLRLTISTKLVAGFAAISVVAVLVGLTGLYFIDKINSTLNNISDVAAPTVETSDDLIALIFKSTTVAEEIIADDNIETIDELVADLRPLYRAFDDRYTELQGLVKDESLLGELATARSAQIEFKKNTRDMVSAHKRELVMKKRSFALLAEFDKIGAALTSALDEFAEENTAEMAKAENRGDELEVEGSTAAEVNAILGHLFDEDFPMVESSLKLQRIIIEMQDTAGEFLAEESTENLKKVKAEFDALQLKAEPHLATLQRFAETEEDRLDILSLKAMLKRWVAVAHGPGQLFATHRERLLAERTANELTEKLEADSDKIAAALDRVAEAADAISDGADEAAEQAVYQAQTTILGLLIMVIIGAIALLALIVLTVVNPIKNLTQAMVSLSRKYGLSSVPELNAGDEIGQLKTAFNHLEVQVQQRTSQLQQRSSELDEANQDLEKELRERRSLEEQLVHAQKIESLGTLAGGIAHDFNNMLYVILGCTELAQKDSSASSSISTLITKIDQAARQSKSIVNQILYFSRQESPNRVSLNLNQVVSESVTLLRAGLPSTMVLEVELDEECGPILADETQIQQIIVNLTTNAFQAHSDQKGHIRLTTEAVEVDEVVADRHLDLAPGHHIRLTVSDTGCGIPPEDLPKVYDPFFTTKPVGEGTGLGLAVVHGIVAAHEGTAVITTEVGKGTSIQVYFPVNSQTETDSAQAA